MDSEQTNNTERDSGRRTTEELEALLNETEASLTEIRGELDRRRQAHQAIEIENLEHHLAEARIRWSDLKVYFDEVLQELKR